MKKEIGILMADLSGYTSMTEVHGGQSAANLVEKFIGLVGKSLQGSARLLERVGDQLVIIGEDANDIAVTALLLSEYSAKEINFLPIHAGLHFGTVFEKDGSYFGTAMNLTARIASNASQGAVWCSGDFIQRLNHPDNFEIVSKGDLKFKNIIHPVSVYELLPCKKRMETMELDPVCNMYVGKNSSYNTNYDGQIFHFCSEHCVELFIQNPEHFTIELNFS